MITFEELKTKLTSEQRKAAELITANDFSGKKDKKTFEEIAEEVGISSRQLYTWRQNPNFTQYMSAISDRELENYRSLADSQLIKLIQGTSNNGLPSIKALELFYKLEGRLVDKSVVMTSNDSNSKMSQEDISKELDKLDKIFK